MEDTPLMERGGSYIKTNGTDHNKTGASTPTSLLSTPTSPYNSSKLVITSNESDVTGSTDAIKRGFSLSLKNNKNSRKIISKVS